MEHLGKGERVREEETGKEKREERRVRETFTVWRVFSCAEDCEWQCKTRSDRNPVGRG